MDYQLNKLFDFIRNGKSIKQGEPGGYPITRIETISNQKVDRSKLGYAGIFELDKYEKYVLEDEDILMSHINSEIHLGKCAIYQKRPNETIIHGMNLLCLRPNRKLISPKFAFYLFQTAGFKKSIGKIAKKSVNQASFSINDLKKINVNIPDLDTQIKIASILDESNRLIQKRQSQITALDELIQSVFLEMFGDPLHPKNVTTTLGSLSTIVMGQSPKGDSYNDNGIGLALLNGPSEFGIINPIEKQWTTNSKKEALPQDILFCVRGATAGRMNIADKEYSIGRGLAAIRVNNEDFGKFIYNSLSMMYDYFQMIGTGSTFININKNQLEEVPIIITTVDKMKKYNHIVDNIEKQKTIMTESLHHMEITFNSLLQKAFKGKLFEKKVVEPTY